MGKEFHFQYFRNANLVYIFSKVFEEIIRISEKKLSAVKYKKLQFQQTSRLRVSESEGQILKQDNL